MAAPAFARRCRSAAIFSMGGPPRQRARQPELRQLQLNRLVEGRYKQPHPVAVMSRSPELLPPSPIAWWNGSAAS